MSDFTSNERPIYQRVKAFPSHITYKTKDGKTIKIRCTKTKLADPVCDRCGRELTSYESIGWGLKITNHRKGPYDGPKCDDPEIEHPYYFCNFECLKKWANAALDPIKK
ncbi:MAG: hypothetical protein K940chlam3_00122 [Chlamydiae bacterium]|nr:hypothetical protein [Chlamydiota bacterium]